MRLLKYEHILIYFFFSLTKRAKPSISDRTISKRETDNDYQESCKEFKQYTRNRRRQHVRKTNLPIYL